MNWEMILSGVTATTAVGGIVLAWAQMKLANKQTY